jgi:hypothetical protein
MHRLAGTGLYYCAGTHNGGANIGFAYAFAADTIYATPFAAPEDMTIPSLLLYSGGIGGGKVMGMAVYACADGDDIRPTTLLATKENVSLTGGGNKIGVFATPLVLTAGTRVWVAVCANAAHSGGSIPVAQQAQPTGLTAAEILAVGGGASQGWTAANAYMGVMPDPFPAAPSRLGAANTTAPAIFVGGW